MNPIELTYDPTLDFVVSVYRGLLWKHNAAYVICSVIIAGIAIWCIVTGSGVGFGAFWLGVIATFCFLLWDGMRQTRAGFSSRGPTTIHLVADEAGCTFRTESASQWFAWSEVMTLEQFKHALVFHRRNGADPMPVPTSALREDIVVTLAQWARGAGARVR